MAKSKAPRARAKTRSTAARTAARKPASKKAARPAARKSRAVRAVLATRAKAKRPPPTPAKARSVAAKSAKTTVRTRRAAAARPRGAAPAKRPTSPLVARKAPSLNRARRLVIDDEIVSSPPSSLDLDTSASAARSGRRALRDRLHEHTETSPAMTGGDIDADWESAYSVGDEAPGGDNPTPDQDIVDEIGQAVGVEYEDNETLKTETKLTRRDAHRWELDPASSDDWKDRD